MKTSVNKKLQIYHLEILKKLISESDFNKIDEDYVSYCNDKKGIIRIIGCPYHNREGGVIYILKSSLDDITNYNIVNKIAIKEKGFIATSVGLITNNRFSHKNILAVSSCNGHVLKVYLYSKIFNKNMITRKLIINDFLRYSQVEDIIFNIPKLFLKNIILVTKDNLIVNIDSNKCEVYELLPTKIHLFIKKRMKDGQFVYI